MSISPLETFLHSERQWTRRVRILHAQAGLKYGREDGRKDVIQFYAAVLSALGATERTIVEIHR